MQFKIEIPKPCHEKWNEMSTTERGRYCASCKKEVFDFRFITKQELGLLVKSNSEICGRFNQNQINQKLSIREKPKFGRLALLLSIPTFLTLNSPIFSQKNENQIEFNETKNSTENLILNDSIVISGNIKDLNGPLPGANISIDRIRKGTTTDWHGNFELILNRSEVKLNEIITVSFIGFEVIKQKIMLNTNHITINEVMTDSNSLIGEVVITSYEKPSIFRRIGNLFKKKDECTNENHKH
ncbi:MAG: hypothetical protein BM563_03585 [Bacteroidetes bacterium MedPE-SWsnd-G1]|nr:MAG: hypothetical protein BM563_03585 [Bacteroidetes bacterium MedPE-SWsnd-G1]